MLDLFPALDLHSRAVGLAAGRAERGTLTQPERLQVAQLTGAYRNDLQALAGRLTPALCGDVGFPAQGAGSYLGREPSPHRASRFPVHPGCLWS